MGKHLLFRRFSVSSARALLRAAGVCALLCCGAAAPAQAATPAGVSVLAVSTGTLEYAWALDNPAEEFPLIVLSSVSDFSVTVASSTGGLGQQSVVFSALVPNTSYYFKVKVSTEDDVNYTAPLALATAIEAPAAVYFDEVATGTIVVSAWAPGPAFSNIAAGLSGVNVTMDGGPYTQPWRSGDVWTAQNPDASLPRTGAGAAVYNGRLYFAGGSDGSPLAYNREFNPATGSWTTKPDMAVNREGLAYAAIAGKLYAVGGSSSGYLGTTAEYSPQTQVWTAKAAMPTPRRGFGAAVIGGKLYAVGGYNGGSLFTNEEYDPVSDTWAPKAAMSVARHRLAAVAIREKLYAVGGLDGATYLADNEEYDPAANTWAPKAAMPTARSGLTAAVVGGRLYAVGGRNASYQAVNEAYDPAADSWVSLSPMPTAREGLSAAAFGGRLYAVYGNDSPVSYLADNEAYDPGTAHKFTGLQPNTLYSFKAKARNRDGLETGEGAEISTRTLAALPGFSAPAFSGVSSGSFTVSWTRNGNPDGSTLYRLQVSTDPAFGALAAANDLYEQTLTLGGFTPNATYYARVAAVSAAGLMTDYLALGSTVTLAETPAGVYFEEISSYALTASAFAPQFTGLHTGLSGLALAKDGGAYSAWRGGNTWAAKAAMTTPRSDLALAAAGGRLYAIGGADGGAIKNTNEEYDPVANAWSAKAAMPTPRAYLAAAAVNGRIYAVGGSSTAVQLAVNEEYDPAANAWTAKAPMPTARRYLAAAAVNGRVYAIGGSPTSLNEEYDPAANSWRSRAAPLTARHSLASAVYDGRIYAVGGSGGFQANEAYDPATDTWAPLAAMPTGRQKLAAAAVGGRIYAVGGAGPLATNEEYNPAADTWAARAAMSAARGYLAAAAVGGRIYAVGGSNGSALGANEEYDPGSAVAYSGLLPNTQYSFTARSANSVRSWGPDSVTVATYTLAAVPGAAAVTGRASVSVSLSWAANNNPLPGTNYLVRYSSSPAFTAAATTYSVVGATFTAVAGLTPDTSYYFDVAAVNGDGVATVYAGAAASTGTPAAVPGAPSITGRGVNTQSVAWSANGNPAWTAYRLARSTSPGFETAVTTVTAVSSTSYTAAGLTPGTSYFYDVAAVNHAGEQTAYTGAPASGYTMPAVPGDPVPTPLGTSSVTWTWALADSATGYNIYSAAVSSVILASVAAPPFVQIGLGTNTLNGILVSAVNLEGESGQSSAVSTWTLAAAPQALSTGPAPVSSGTIDVSWDANGNPAGTSFSLRYWTQAGSTSAISTVDASTQAAGLSPDTTYYFDVTAYNGAGLASPAASLVMPTLPAAPGGLWADPSSLGELDWGWDAAQTALAYRVYAGTEQVLLAEINANYLAQVALSSNTLYHLSVAAVNLAGEGEKSPVVGAYTLAAQPAGLAVTQSSDTAAVLAWSSSGNPDPGTDYLVRYSTSPAFTALVTTVTVYASTTAAQVENLAPNTSYYFDAAARSGAGLDTSYTGAPVSTVTLASVPGAPEIYDATDIDQSVRWDPRGNPAGATGYLLRQSTSPGFEAAVTTVTALVSTYTTVVNLLPNTSYFYDVAAVSRLGQVTAYTGVPAQAYTMAEVPGVPVLTTWTVTAQRLEWSPAGNPLPGTNYYLEYSTSPGFEPASTASVVSASTFTTVTGLLSGTSYYYRVASLNQTGNRSAFAPGTAAGYTLSAAPEGLAGTPLGVSSVSWTWNASTGAALYRIYPSTDPLALLAEQAAPPFLQLNLASNTLNGIYVSAVNPAGEGPRSAPLERWTLAGVPGTPLIVARSTYSQTLNWDPAGNLDAYTDYRLRYSTSPGFEAGATSYTFVTSTAATVTGLAVGTSYYYGVAAINADLTESAYTSAEAAGYTLPDLPAAPAAEVLGVSSVSWSWPAVASASFYNIHPATAPADIVASTPAAVFVHAGLPQNSLIAITVSAVNPGGEGAQSAVASTYTLAALPGAPVVSTRTSNSQQVTWDANGNPPGTDYLLRRSTASDFSVYSETPLSSTVAVVTFLAANTSYYYDVAAISVAGARTPFTGMPAARYTLAATPGTPFFISASTWSQTVGWLDASNPVPGTDYVVRHSTSANFTLSVTTYALTSLTQADIYGLQPNTSYYYDVAAVTGDSTLSEFTGAPKAGYTRAAVPGAPYITAQSSDTQTVAWAPNGNPAGTKYTLKYSVSPDLVYPVQLKENLTSTFTTVTGLQPGTTYYYDVLAVNVPGLVTAYTGLPASGSTLSTPPGTPVPAALGVSSLTWTWGAVGGALSYNIYPASAPSVMAASTTGTAYTATGLSTNTSYGILVAAVSPGGEGAKSDAVSAYTLAAPPLALSTGPAAVTVGTITVQWLANTNPAGTYYRVDYSSAGGSAVTSSTQLSSAVLAGLTDSVTYYITVRASNGDGLLSAAQTLVRPTLPGVPAGLAGEALDAASLRWTWTPVPTASAYKIYSAFVPTSTIAVVTASSFTETGLSTDTLNGVLVSAVNESGEGSKTAALSTYTLAAVPIGLSTGPVASSSSSITVQWSANGNPPGTAYAFGYWFAGSATSTAVTALTSATVSGLEPGTTYYFSVRAANTAGLYGAPALLASPTLSPAADRPEGTALSSSSISWNWPAVPTAVAYSVYLASEPGTVAYTAAGVPFEQTGLQPNTAYSVLVAAVNGAGTGLQSEAGFDVYTLANPPDSPAVDAVFVTSAALSWGLNGNPAGTAALVSRSTDNVAYDETAAGGVTAFNAAGLAGCTTYYFRIRNRNEASAFTAYASTLTLFTYGETPLPPGSLSAEALAGRRIRLTWAPSMSGAVTRYALYADSGTGTVDYVSPAAVFASSVTSYTTEVLTASAAYRFGLRAALCGTEEANISVTAAAAAVDALPQSGAYITVPQTGRKVSGNRVTVLAALYAGSEAFTRQVLFQFRNSTDAAWTDITAAEAATHPNPDTGAPYLVHWDVSALPPAAYDLRAVAYDLADSSDTAAPSVGVTVDPADPDISEDTIAGGAIRKQQKAHNTADNTVQSASAGSAEVAAVTIPAGALDSSTVTVTLVSNPTSLPPPPADAQGVGSAAEIRLLNGQTLLAGGRTAAVTLSYADADGDGLVDGLGVRADTLRIYSAAALAGPWSRDFASAVNLSSRTVTGSTPHFSFFALFAPLGVEMDGIQVYPVPYIPGDGDADNGVPYNGAAGTGITFDKVPSAVKIKVYTVTGQLAASFSSANTSGKLQWDAKNGDGRDLASGGYIAVISSPGRGTVTRKVLIVR